MRMRVLMGTVAAWCFALTAAAPAGTFTPEWNDTVKIDRNPENTGAGLRNPKFVGSVGSEPKTGFPLVSIEVADGALVVDTRAFKAEHPDGRIVLRFPSLPFTEAHRLRNAFMELTLAGAPEGLKGLLYFEGAQGGQNKHYWKMTEFLLGAERQTIRYEQILPADLNEVHMRVDLPSAGVYRLFAGAYGQVEAVAVDASKNHITNGGAEYGWYDIGLHDAKTFALADDPAVPYEGWGKKNAYTGMMEASLDREVKHGGLYAFRIAGGRDRAGKFQFNSVPFVSGGPSTFSVWLKGERENMEVSLSLFLSNGFAYGNGIRVGTEWKRYELAIPRWGDEAPNVSKINDVANGEGEVFRQAEPHIISYDGTIWADDAAYHLGPVLDPAGPTLSVRGGLSPARHYVTAGTEPIKAKLSLESATARPGVAVAWEIVDFFGKRLAASDAPLAVDLAAGTAADRDFSWTPPAAYRGPVEWRFTVDGKRFGWYAGVIGPAAPQLARLGMNYDSRQNAETVVALMKDFRFGSVRMWSEMHKYPYQGFRDVPYFKRANFYVMMCLGLTGAAPAFLVPLDFTDWKAQLAAEAGKVRGQVDAYEILNESNIWSGRVPVGDPSKYEEMTPAANVRVLRAAAEALRAADPGARIAGPASCHTDINWTANLLKDGADPYLDIITEHPYRELPELPDYEEDIHALRAATDRYRKDYPLMATEAGRQSIHIYPNGAIPPMEAVRIGYNVRLMLIAFANGVEQYHHFAVNTVGGGSAYSLTLTGNPDTDYLPKPAPVLFALRAAADRLENAKPAGRVRLGAHYRCYVFDRGNKRVAALWKWSGEPATFRLDGDTAAAAQAFDVMGNVLPAGTLTLGTLPVYLETALPAEVFSRRLLASAGSLGAGAGVASTLVVTGENSFGIQVRNLGGAPVSGTVKLLTAGVGEPSETRFDAVPREGGVVLPFRALAPVRPADRPLAVEVSVAGKAPERKTFNLKSILVPRATKPIVVDGDLSDWPEVSRFAELNRNNAVKRGDGVVGGGGRPYRRVAAGVGRQPPVSRGDGEQGRLHGEQGGADIALRRRRVAVGVRPAPQRGAGPGRVPGRRLRVFRGTIPGKTRGVRPCDGGGPA